MSLGFFSHLRTLAIHTDFSFTMYGELLYAFLPRLLQHKGRSGVSVFCTKSLTTNY